MTALTVRDETAAGEVRHESRLQFPTQRITIRELIRERVYQEVQDYNRRRDDAAAVFHGLVRPADAKPAPASNGGFCLTHGREIDWKKQFDKACDAFEQNGFFILVGQKQAESLDEEIELRRELPVAFVRLTPLVGG